MTIQFEMNLKNFPFWGAAADFVPTLSRRELEIIQQELESCKDSYTATELNDFFSFEQDRICELLDREPIDE